MSACDWNHTHTVRHESPDYNGLWLQMCECGATRRIKDGKPLEPWHTCKFCTPQFFQGKGN